MKYTAEKEYTLPKLKELAKLYNDGSEADADEAGHSVMHRLDSIIEDLEHYSLINDDPL